MPIRSNFTLTQLIRMFHHQQSLLAFNTFHMDVCAEHFASFAGIDRLRELLEEIRTADPGAGKPRMVLGGGSNILFTGNISGYVLKNELKGIEAVGEDNGNVYLKVGAGENWHSFVMHCLDQGLSGVENLALIPGNVGASPMQNIGAYGVELKDVFHELEAVDWQTGELTTFSLNDCGFGYRESVFKNKYRNRFIIASVTYRLSRQPDFRTDYGAIRQELDNMGVQELTTRAIAQAVMNIRRSKLPDPAVIGNAGSFFKNPEVDRGVFEELKQRFPGIVGYETANGQVKLAAGWLIEHCGPSEGTSWKGYRVGDAGCHAKQALVLVNYGKARGSEIKDLAYRIIEKVRDVYGVSLQPEVNII